MTAVTVAGDRPTNHWVLTLTATATTARIDVDTDPEPPLSLHGFAVGDTLVLDGEAHTFTSQGSPLPAGIDPGSGWPRLWPGVNNITVTGATGSLAYRPVYL